jgi:excisionase family DNA binding protein
MTDALDTLTAFDGDDYMSVSEAASMLGVHRDTLRRWSDSGLVKVYRTPTGHRRFLRSELGEIVARKQIAS